MLLAVLCAAVGYGASQAVAFRASDPGEFKASFEGKTEFFCPPGDLLEHMETEVAVGERGHSSPDGAVREYEAALRANADRFVESLDSTEAGKASRAEFVDLLAPMRDLRHTAAAATSDVAYFDVAGEEGDHLLSRLVVRNLGPDGWKIAEAITCTTALVTDPDRALELQAAQSSGLVPAEPDTDHLEGEDHDHD